MTTQSNPYQTPAEVSNEPSEIRGPRSGKSIWLQRLIAAQAFVIVGALILEAYEHETIVATGPVFFLVGLAITNLAAWRRDVGATIFGSSAVLLSLTIVFLINVNSWSPEQGDRPITFIIFVYACLALPEAAYLTMKKRQRIPH